MKQQQSETLRQAHDIALNNLKIAIAELNEALRHQRAAETPIDPILRAFLDVHRFEIDRHQALIGSLSHLVSELTDQLAEIAARLKDAELRIAHLEDRDDEL